MELSRAPQFRNGNWTDPAEVGIEELYGIHFGMTDQTVRSVAELLGSGIRNAVLVNPPDEKNELQLLTPAFIVFQSDTWLVKYMADLRLYMETCIASSKNPGNLIQFLVTDDHGFFKVFIQSMIAESVLQRETMKILELNKCVRVRLAGEIIPGV